MTVDGALADAELGGDLAVRPAVGEQPEDLDLARAQRAVTNRFGPSDQLVHPGDVANRAELGKNRPRRAELQVRGLSDLAGGSRGAL